MKVYLEALSRNEKEKQHTKQDSHKAAFQVAIRLIMSKLQNYIHANLLKRAKI